MPKFRKKPVVIEARRYARDKLNADRVAQWCGGTRTLEGLVIHTLEGSMLAEYGDWIIKGVKGEFYPCKPDIFNATYEPVDPLVPGTGAMKLSELIAAYGDDNVKVQALDRDASSISWSHTHGTKITFVSAAAVGPDGLQDMGIVVWLDRKRYDELVNGPRKDPDPDGGQ